MPKPAPPVDRETSEEYWWQGDPTPWGAITASAVFSNYSDSPSSNGWRISYGPMGIGEEYFGWAELWYSFQETGDVNISSTGITLAAISIGYRRIALGVPTVILGFERRSDGSRHVLAGEIGLGAEFIVRLFRRWDFVATVEQSYRTTAESELQGRLAIRFHHERLASSIWKDD